MALKCNFESLLGLIMVQVLYSLMFMDFQFQWMHVKMLLIAQIQPYQGVTLMQLQMNVLVSTLH